MIIISINLRVVFNFQILLFTYVIPFSTQGNLRWFQSNFLKTDLFFYLKSLRAGIRNIFCKVFLNLWATWLLWQLFSSAASVWKQLQTIRKWLTWLEWAFSLTPTLDGNFLTVRCWHFIYDILFVIDSYKLCITIKTVDFITKWSVF